MKLHSKKILFELNHPAHGHLFKNLIRQLKLKGHEVMVLVKDVEVLKAILDYEGIEHECLGKKGSNRWSKMLHQLSYLKKTRRLYMQHKFDLGIGVSVTLPLLSRMSSLKSLVLDDDDKSATPLFAMLAHKNASALLRPAALKHESENQKTIYYQGYHELAYLHPEWFEPDESVLLEQGLKPGEPFFLIRLVSLKAHHDVGIKGISKDQIKEIIKKLSPIGKVILTHEIPGENIQGTQSLLIHPAKLHHLMSFASLIISDGQTMCSEAACLGVPSIRINDFVGRISYLEEQEKRWKLTFGFKPQDFGKAMLKIDELLQTNSTIFQQRKNEMIENSINLTAFLVWFVENWPQSIAIAMESRDLNAVYQNRK